jgi:hypothetical protein
MICANCGSEKQSGTHCTNCWSALAPAVSPVAEQPGAVPDGTVRSSPMEDRPLLASPRAKTALGVHGLLHRWGLQRVVAVAATLALVSVSLAAWSFAGRFRLPRVRQPAITGVGDPKI